MFRQVLRVVAVSGLVFSAAAGAPAATVIYRPALIPVGLPIPPAPFSIDPPAPTTSDVIHFSAPLDGEVYSNACYAAAALRGQPVLDIDEGERVINILFDGVFSDICPEIYDPVTGAMGEFGPLAVGDWTFYNSHGGSLDFAVVPATPADFDGDGNVDLADLNALTAEANLATGLAVPPAGAKFDLSNDDIVDSTDLDQWLADAATINGLDSPYLGGDANLDGDVDVWVLDGSGDAQLLSANLGTTSGAVWGDGDFNGDGDVDVWAADGSGDAQTLSSNLPYLSSNGQTTFVPATVIVPEPSTIAMLVGLGLLGLLRLIGFVRRRNRQILTPRFPT